MVESRHVHWVAVKHVLRYLRDTVGYGLRYFSGGEVRMQGYVDSDWTRSAVDRRSTLGCCFSFESDMISWFSRKQASIALSIAEAEHIAAKATIQELVWLQKLLAGLFDQVLETTLIYCDKSYVKLSKNHVFHDRKKIEIKYHFIQDMVQKGAVKLLYISTDK